MTLFWDESDWQSLCEWCDKNLKRAIENAWLKGADVDLHLNRRIPGWVHPRHR